MFLEGSFQGSARGLHAPFFDWSSFATFSACRCLGNPAQCTPMKSLHVLPAANLVNPGYAYGSPLALAGRLEGWDD
jgi:hypothetical protein